jgi:hypothetical protein
VKERPHRRPWMIALLALAVAVSGVQMHLIAQSTASTSAQPKTPAAKLVLPPGVEKLCSIEFDKDAAYPARIEKDALPCLGEIVAALSNRPTAKIVLVGVSDPVKDHEEKDNGVDREEEDMTGHDIRFEDLAAYRAVNTKAYLVRWHAIDPARILPTTNEFRHGQEVSFYLVPQDANFTHNYLDTTRSNESPCTVTPCWDPREESLTAQPQEKLPGDTAQEQSH